MTERSDYDVFISHSSKDLPWALEFASALKESGVKAWLDETDVAPGDDWQERFQDALRASRVLVVIILSESNLDDPWTLFQLGAAVAGEKRIVPVVAGEVPSERLPPVLRRYQVLREPSPQEAGKRIARVVEKELESGVR